MPDVTIRPYKKEDRQQVRDIAWETAFIGKPGNKFFADRELLCDFLVLYFTDHEPGSCFVACDKDKVVGYLIGSRDTKRMALVFRKKILLPLLVKLLFRGVLLSKRNLRLFFNFFRSFLKGEFLMPDLHQKYPATLHINLRQGFRGAGTGARLVLAYLNMLRRENIPGVYLATMSEKAGKFFSLQGFSLLYSYPRTYFSHITNKPIRVYIYARDL